MTDSTDKKITDSPPKMGRPPIGKFTAVRLAEQVLIRIDALVGKGKRAAFIREAVDRELDRREAEKSDPD